MNWVVDHVKRNGWRGLVNMSLGGPRSTALNDAAQQLINAGIPVVSWLGAGQGGGKHSVQLCGCRCTCLWCHLQAVPPHLLL